LQNRGEDTNTLPRIYAYMIDTPISGRRHRIDEAARYLDLNRPCLSLQCSFASTEEVNLLTADQQWAKLQRIVEIAAKVWS